MKLQSLVRILSLTLTLSCAHVNKQNTQQTSLSSAPTVAPAAVSDVAPAVPAVPIKKESALQPRGLDFGATIKRIAFGSTANQNFPQPIWPTILNINPDIFLFMGDTVQTLNSDQKPTSEQYRKLNSIPEYRAFREKIPFLATWDDQEYGLENGGSEHPNKELSKKEFIRNWTYIRDSISMEQAGIYHAKIIGPKKKQVQFIMLDTRSFRSPLSKEIDPATGVSKILPNQESKATILGNDQWSWLEEQLKRPAQVRFVVTSLPLIAAENRPDQATETWSNFPSERQRFFDLLKKNQIRNVILLSGNSRQGAIAKTTLNDWGTLYDITSSPLNEPTTTSPYQDPSYIEQTSNVENFGLAEVDWALKRVQIQIRGKNNEILSSASIKIL